MVGIKKRSWALCCIAGVIALSGCKVGESNDFSAEAASDQTAAEAEVDTGLKVEEAIYSVDEANLEVEMNMPSAFRGTRSDINLTRALQKPFIDQINIQMTNADMNAGRSTDYEKMHIAGDFEIVFEDETIIVVEPISENDLWWECVTVEKATGTRLGYDMLPSDDAFWSTVDQRLSEANLLSVGKDQRRNTFRSYYITEEDLVLLLPKWFSQENKRGELRIPLKALNLSKETLLTNNTPLYEIGSMHHRVSEPYYTFAGEIPVFSSAAYPERAKELTDFFKKQIIMSEKLIQDDAKYVFESNKADGYAFPPDVHNVQFDVIRNDADIVSLFLTYYEYTGGAHGNHYDLAYNIDAKTGEILKLEDVFKQDANYIGTLSRIIEEEIEKVNTQNESEGLMYYDGFEGIRADQHFYLTDHSLVVFFDLYEIAPYAAGIPMFEVPFADIEDILALD